MKRKMGLFGTLAMFGLLMSGCGSGEEEATTIEPEQEVEETVASEDTRKEDTVEGYTAAMYNIQVENFDEEVADEYVDEYADNIRCTIETVYDDLSDETVEAFISEDVTTLTADEAETLFMAAMECE